MRTTEPSTFFALASSGARARTRSPAGRGRSAWALLLAATLAFKAFVPLLAAVSAQMQGVPVGEVCAVYGVRLAAPATTHHHHHGATHYPGHTTDVAMDGMDAAGSTSHHPPVDGGGHSRDHCALNGLAVCAVSALAPWGLADWCAASAPPPRSGADIAPSHDASARWLALRLHAPPLLA